jgi:hypothetical protein
MPMVRLMMVAVPPTASRSRSLQANWNTPVAITVTAVDDGDAEGNHTATQTYSASQGGAATYDGLSGNGDHSDNITDNDTAPEEDAEPSIATTPASHGRRGYSGCGRIGEIGVCHRWSLGLAESRFATTQASD